MRTYLFQLLTVATLVVILFLTSCQQKEITLSFLNEQKEPISSFKLEVARSKDEIRQGLMYRKTMPRERGMLFIFPDEKPRSFWMKNTYISLDIIFIDKMGKIVSISHKTPPLSTKSRKSVFPAKFVVEINGGLSKELGIQKGSYLKLPSMTL